MPPAATQSRRVLSEFQLIKIIERRFAGRHGTVVMGIGDDAAILRHPRRSDALLTTDLLAEGVHFDAATASWNDIGYKAVAANVSDIAAMGGRPLHLVVALAVPPRHPTRDTLRLYHGIGEACRRWNIALVGGDTSASRRDVFLSLTLTGAVPNGHALRRDGARVGDDVYVTGTLGDARAGLDLLKRRTTSHGDRYFLRHASFLIRRHRRPTPRVDLGAWLASRGLAHAAIDLSDGLSGDVRHLCERSDVGIQIEEAALPLSAALQAYATLRARSGTQLALAGGEDYELLFTAPPRMRPAVSRAERRFEAPITRIGTIVPASNGRHLQRRDGRRVPLPEFGYEHFARRNGRIGPSGT